MLVLAPSTRAEDPPPAALTENAALDYWKACALLRVPRTPEETVILNFITDGMPSLPPGVLSIRSGAGRWLLEEAPAWAALADAAARPACVFSAPTGSPVPNRDYLPYLDTLSRHALEAAKAFEYYDNKDGAATIYTSLLGLAAHLDRGNDLNACIFAADIIQHTLGGLVGFLSREPPSSAATILTRYFANLPEQTLHLDRYIEVTADRYAEWLQGDPDLMERRLETLYVNAREASAVDQLITLPRDKKIVRLEKWIEDYRARIDALAEETRKPYQLGLFNLRDLDAEKNALKEAEPGTDVNPLVPLLVPSMERAYERFLLAEAQMTMAAVVSAAALYHADLGKWPKSLEEVASFVGRTFNRDPFTGQAIQYKLRKGMPRVGVRAPKRLVEQPGIIHVIDLADRKRTDQERVEQVIKDIQTETRREKIRQRQATMEP